jgi:hypothetical protein
MALMAQLRDRSHPDKPPPFATHGKGGYREAMVETWGQCPNTLTRVDRPPRSRRSPTGITCR